MAQDGERRKKDSAAVIVESRGTRRYMVEGLCSGVGSVITEDTESLP